MKNPFNYAYYPPNTAYTADDDLVTDDIVVPRPSIIRIAIAIDAPAVLSLRVADSVPADHDLPLNGGDPLLEDNLYEFTLDATAEVPINFALNADCNILYCVITGIGS